MLPSSAFVLGLVLYYFIPLGFLVVPLVCLMVCQCQRQCRCFFFEASAGSPKKQTAGCRVTAPLFALPCCCSNSGLLSLLPPNFSWPLLAAIESSVVRRHLHLLRRRTTIIAIVTQPPKMRENSKWQSMVHVPRLFLRVAVVPICRKYTNIHVNSTLTRLYVGTDIFWIMFDRTNALKSFSTREWLCWLVIDLNTFFNKFHPLQNDFVT